jgi:hypothetical protein
MKKYRFLLICMFAGLICSSCKNKEEEGMSGIEVNLPELLMSPGDSVRVNAIPVPASVIGVLFSWTSNNPEVATVTNGLVKAVGEGAANITVTASSGHTRTIPVTVLSELASAEQIDDRSGKQIGIGGMGHPTWTDQALQFGRMKEAGMTFNFPIDLVYTRTGFDDNSVRNALNVAQMYGIKVFVEAEYMLSRWTQDLVDFIKVHPALGGYYVWDEPFPRDLDLVAARYNSMRALDPNEEHLLFVNLLPLIEESETYIKPLLQKIPALQFLSFDFYGVREIPGSPPFIAEEWFEAFEFFSSEAKRAGIPFWSYTMSAAHGPFHIYEWRYPVATVDHFRLANFTALAYGAQAIAYFTYWGPGHDPYFDWPISPISGEQTPTWHAMKKVNLEIVALSKVFVDAEVLWTTHAGTVPRGCTRFEQSMLPEAVESLEVMGGTGAIVSLLKKGRDNFLVVVNHDVNLSTSVKAKGKIVLNRVKKDGSIVVADNNRTYSLTPGDMMVYFWKTR